jgi:hypothetical protein
LKLYAFSTTAIMVVYISADGKQELNTYNIVGAIHNIYSANKI